MSKSTNLYNFQEEICDYFKLIGIYPKTNNIIKRVQKSTVTVNVYIKGQ
ncbi:hypothetical protein [Aliarcobacter butzleri]|nr:hypothetical protein [Aliarcobacter butzleri]